MAANPGAEPSTASGIGFETASYTLSGGTITLAQNTNSGWLNEEMRTDAAADTIGSDLALPGSMNKTGSGKLTLTGVSTVGMYIGAAVAIQNGTLVVAGGDDRLPLQTAIFLAVAATAACCNWERQRLSQTVARVFTSGTGTGNRIVGGSDQTSTLTVDASDATLPWFKWDEYDGILGGEGTNQNNLRLAETGGVLMLTGDNTYTGGTYVSGGQCTWGSDNAFGSGQALTVP